jgi:2,3-bisphosphoglycerate-dependent phosphoglycerate mutase
MLKRSPAGDKHVPRRDWPLIDGPVRFPPMSVLVLVRHGQSQWNLENRFTGWIDVPLTDKGREEARLAGELLQREKLRFTKATPDIILDVLGQTGVPIVRDQALNERHYGELQGLNKAETAEKFGKEQVQLWRRSYDVPPPGGESLKDTAARTLPYFRKHIVPDLAAGETILVAAHGNSLRSIVMDLDHLSEAEVVSLELATGVPIVYEFDDGMRVISKRILAS